MIKAFDAEYLQKCRRKKYSNRQALLFDVQKQTGRMISIERYARLETGDTTTTINVYELGFLMTVLDIDFNLLYKEVNFKP